MNRQDRRLEKLQDSQIQCQCTIPPCTIYQRESGLGSTFGRDVHCSRHCHRNLDKINRCLDDIVRLNRDIIQIEQEINLFTPISRVLLWASLFTPLLETNPTFLFGDRAIDPRLSEQLTTTWAAELAADRAGQLPRVNQEIYSFIRPLGPHVPRAAGFFSMVGILAGCICFLQPRVSETE